MVQGSTLVLNKNENSVYNKQKKKTIHLPLRIAKLRIITKRLYSAIKEEDKTISYKEFRNLIKRCYKALKKFKKINKQNLPLVDVLDGKEGIKIIV